MTEDEGLMMDDDDQEERERLELERQEDDDRKLLEEARDRFKMCVDAESDQRHLSLEDLRFKSGEQWPESVRRERERDRKPVLTINMVPSYVRQVVNDIRQLRPGIKVRPVDSVGDPQAAEVMNGMIRAIQADSGAEKAYDWAAQGAVDMGFGYFRVDIEFDGDDTFDRVLKIRRVKNHFTVYLDPFREEPDGSDAEFGFVSHMISRDEYERRYPDAPSSFGEDMQVGTVREHWFADNEVRLAEYWRMEVERVVLSRLPDGSSVVGEHPAAVSRRFVNRRIVTRFLITGDRVLERSQWPGIYIPIIEVRGVEEVIDGETRLKGMVRDLMDPQVQYNYTQSFIVERLQAASKSPWIGPAGSFTDPKWKRANKTTVPYLEYEIVAQGYKPEPAMPVGVDAGLMQQLMTSFEQMRHVAGIYGAGQGDRSNEVSGVAIHGRKQESDVSNFHFMDNLSYAMKHHGRVLVDLIPHVYGGRVVSILKPDGSEDTWGINAPHLNAQTGKNQEVDIKAGRYDVSIDDGPSYTTQRVESVDSMLKFVGAFPPAAQIAGDLIAKNMDWPDASEFANRLKMLLPPELLQNESPHIANIMRQHQQQMQQMQQMIAQQTEFVKELQSQINEKDLQLKNKADELSLKQRSLDKDLQKVWNDFATKMTEIEAKHGVQVPGGMVPPGPTAPGPAVAPGPISMLDVRYPSRP